MQEVSYKSLQNTALSVYIVGSELRPIGSPSRTPQCWANLKCEHPQHRRFISVGQTQQRRGRGACCVKRFMHFSWYYYYLGNNFVVNITQELSQLTGFGIGVTTFLLWDLKKLSQNHVCMYICMYAGTCYSKLAVHVPHKSVKCATLNDVDVMQNKLINKQVTEGSPLASSQTHL